MESQVKELSPTEVELAVEVPWEAVNADLEKHYKKLARTAKVRGFRPGKVPQKVVKKVFAREVEAEVTAHLIEHACMEAIAEHELPIVTTPSVKDPVLTHGEGLKFTATLEVQPKIDEVVTEGLSAKRPSPEVSDDAVGEELEQLRRHHATVSEPEPMRPAQDHDLLLIDYDVTIDGEPKPDMGAEGRPVELGDGHLLPELHEALLGASPGDEREATVTFDDDHPNEDLKGKTAVFAVRVKELKEQILPDLDDEFAKDCDHDSLEELRASTRARLEEAAARRSEGLVKERILDALLSANEVPVPPTMLQEQRRRMMYEALQFAQMMGQQGGGMPPGMFDGLDERAERRVKAGLLLGAFARQEKLEVSEEELDAEYQKIADRTGKHIAKVRADHAGDRAAEVESELMEEKIWALLYSRVRIEDEPADGADAPSGADE